MAQGPEHMVAPLSVQTPKMQDCPFHFCVLMQQTPPRRTHWFEPLVQEAEAFGGLQDKKVRVSRTIRRATRRTLFEIFMRRGSFRRVAVEAIPHG
jgi:hypothetical protein